MRRLIGILFFWCWTCFAQSPAQYIDVDFGNIAPNAVAIKEISLKDEIRNVVTSCGCVKATTFQKGSSFIVHIEFDPKEYLGDVKQEVIVVDVHDNATHIAIRAHIIDSR